MPELDFFIADARPVPYAATPQLAFKLRIEQSGEIEKRDIQSVMLRCQIRVEPNQRRYQPAEQSRLLELFGEPQRWGQTVRSMLWTNELLNVAPFRERIAIDLIVPCSFDFNIAITKYLDALQDGEIPLCMLFSGTIFYTDEQDALQVDQISWEKEATFRLPVKTWREMIAIYYPNSAWLCVRKDAFDRLANFKTRRGLSTFDAAIDRLLDRSDAEVGP